MQDNATVHVAGGRWPTIVGDGVTVGHAAVLHGCTVGDHCLIGIGAIVLDGAVRRRRVPGRRRRAGDARHAACPPRSLVLGSPARRVRELSADEIARLHDSAANYVEHARRYRARGRSLGTSRRPRKRTRSGTPTRPKASRSASSR